MFGAPFLFGFAFVIGVTPAIVFPSEREFAQASGNDHASAYSLAYLDVLVRAAPADPQLRVVYVRQLASLGRWDAAMAALGTEWVRSNELRAVRFELMLARARSLVGEARAAAFREIREIVTAMADERHEYARAIELARLALELEAPDLAVRYYLKLAETETDEEVRANALFEAGRWLRATGNEVGAAEVLLRAAPRRLHLLAAADALEAAGRTCDAAFVLAREAKTSNDIALVERATVLMTSCGRPNDAKMLGRRTIALEPNNAARRRAQVHRELAAGDARGALTVLKGLLARHPDDVEARRTAARVAEWAGEPQVALDQWMWLLGRGAISRP